MCSIRMLVYILIFILIPSSVAADKNFYLTPRIGWSTFTGNIGIELQYKHFAFDIGDLTGKNIKHYLTFGFKYYFYSNHSTIYTGIGGGVALTDNEGDSESTPVTSHTGLIIGYRWRWNSKWELNLGLGPLFPLKKGEEGPLMLDLVLGYSF